MTNNELLTKVENTRNGAFIYIEYCSYIKPLKAYKEAVIQKVTKGVFRLGVSYAHMKSHKDTQTESLPYGEWNKSLMNKIIEHNGKSYLRIYTTNNHKHRPHVEWFINGQKTTKQELIDNGVISKTYAKPSEHVELFNVHIENVIQLGSR